MPTPAAAGPVPAQLARYRDEQWRSAREALAKFPLADLRESFLQFTTLFL
jgi:hypothetical protein